MAKISKQNDRRQAVVLPARSFCFEIEAILTSCGFDQFCSSLRWQALKYIYIPATCRLALSKIASNLDENIYEFAA